MSGTSVKGAARVCHISFVTFMIGQVVYKTEQELTLIHHKHLWNPGSAALTSTGSPCMLRSAMIHEACTAVISHKTSKYVSELGRNTLRQHILVFIICRVF